MDLLSLMSWFRCWKTIHHTSRSLSLMFWFPCWKQIYSFHRSPVFNVENMQSLQISSLMFWFQLWNHSILTQMFVCVVLVWPAMYGGLAFAGSLICNFTGVDLWGGFDLSPQVITTGFGYAVPPMMVLLFILEVCFAFPWLLLQNKDKYHIKVRAISFVPRCGKQAYVANEFVRTWALNCFEEFSEML